MTPISFLAKAVNTAFAQVFEVDIPASQFQFQRTRKEFEGEFTLVVFPLLRQSKKKPEETGELLGNKLVENDAVKGFQVVKGFLNLTLKAEFWIEFLNDIHHQESYGFGTANSKPHWMVEYSSPNTNKPLHLGHLRNNFLGYSVSAMLKAAGYKISKTQIINDKGIHICKSMAAWQAFAEGATPESKGVKGDKLVGNYYVKFDQEYKKQVADLVAQGATNEEAAEAAPIMKQARELLVKWENGESETVALWKQMNQWVYDGFASTYQRMGVDFDKLYYESNTYLTGKQFVLDGLEKGIFYKKEDGSVWVDLTDDGLDQKLLLRADGTSIYMTQDIGTAVMRYQDFPDLNALIYTVGDEQDYHFKVLFIILQKLGYDWAKNCAHLSYGMVDLPSGKMKSREGTVVDADDLMADVVNAARERSEELGKLEDFSKAEKSELFEILGLGAIKYYLLKVDPQKRMQFNPAESVDLQGNTAPFIQYTYARIQSLLRKSDLPIEDLADIETSEIERDILATVSTFPTTLKEAADSLSPALLANYSYDLVKRFNQFYQTMPIAKEEDAAIRGFRLRLSKLVADNIQSAMSLLGIAMPDRM